MATGWRGREIVCAALLLGCDGGPGEGGAASTSTGAGAAETDEPGPVPTTQADTSPGTDTSADTGEPTTGSASTSTGADPTGPEATAAGSSSEPDPDTTAASDPTADPTSDPTGDACEAEAHAGVATYYAADGTGNCSFDAAPGDPLVAAMNHADYAASAACGACVAIDGPDGKATVRIVDRCPECPQGHIDLHPDAFAMLADPQLGVVPISWRYVSCPTPGNITYHFKEGSNPWWTAVQIRGHRNAIASFEYKDAMGDWKGVQRVDYNFFVDESGMGPGPFSFRVTDVLGNTLEDSGVPFVEAGDSPGAGQFPACG